MRAEGERVTTRNLQASGDLDALRLLVETAAEHSLPDEYEVKVTVGFMRGLAFYMEQQAAPQPPLARDPEWPLPQEC